MPNSRRVLMNAHLQQVIEGELSPDQSVGERAERVSEVRAKIVILACGALAKEILHLIAQLPNQAIDLQCLPAKLHNTPQFIVPQMQVKLDRLITQYQQVFVAYADCGTGGDLDRLLEKYDCVERLEGAHCYATYTGQEGFADLMDSELGSFFLTDYMVRHFDRLIIEGMGLDKHPELHEMYFAHYRKVVYLAQMPSAELQNQAEIAAKKLKLAYEYRYTGMGELATFIEQASRSTKE